MSGAEAGRREGGAARVDVVALVASAGGLEAVSAVLRGLPEDFPAAVVVGQHLGGQGSTLVDILGRRTRLPVDWARDGRPLRAGHVTVCPPRTLLEVLPDGTCSTRATESVVSDRPLDALLTSVGDSFGAAALAVVLTGMGDDAAGGAAAMRAAGGVVIAQSEETAEQPAMPRAAVAAGAVDLVLPLHQIGAAVVDAVAGRPLPRPDNEGEAIRFVFGERGAIAELARRINWSATPLGAVSEWPEAQRVVARLAMQSPHGVTLYFGENHVVLFNDATVPVIGDLERVFARPFAEGFPEVADQLLPVIEGARAGGHFRHEASFLPFSKHGRIVDSWFDISFTPVYAADGAVLGVQQPYLERTEEVLSRRRLQALNRLATTGISPNRREAITAAVDVLTDTEDVPFAAAYQFDAPRRVASLVSACGVEPGSGMAPHRLQLRQDAAWPLEQTIGEESEIVVDDVASRFRGQRVGVDELSLERAVLYPIRGDGDAGVVGVIVLGVHPRVELDAGYREFLTLVGETITAKVNEAHARQRERQRLERLAELDRAKTEFFSNVSHEFRTPLTLMLGPLEELLEDADGLPPERKANLELVRRNGRRLLRLVSTMLDFSQIEAGRMRARFAPVDLAERTREIVAEFESAAARAGVDLRVELEELPELVWVDVEMWEKIVSNLLSNALKFTFDGEIEVTLRALPKHAELVVRDTGVGIPEEELPHIFKRFHRIRETRARTYEGAGIGLALVDELVRRHHGRIRAASALGEGTTLTVWIPVGRRPTMPEALSTEPPTTTAVAALMAEEAAQWSEAPEPQSADDDDRALRQSLRNYAPGARVLVADDHKDMRDYLRRLFAPHWTVELAPDGTKALELARANPPDLVLADVMMPGLDGFALLRELRGDENLRAVPVVLVTARAGEESAVEGLLAGADDYIVKPFSARELVARVGGQLELARARRHAAELNAFRVGLSDAVRALTDPIEIQQTACRMLVEQLQADRARFVEIDEATGEFVTLGGYSVEGMPGGYGRYRLDDYAPLARAIAAGRRLVIEDTQHDRDVGEIGPALAAIQIGAQLVLPLARNGATTATLTVHQRTPRRWTNEDVAIAEEVAGRTWAEVERVRAEAALRESEERHTFLLRLSDALRPLADPDAIHETASRMTAEHLDIGRVAYCEIRYEPDVFVIVERDWPRRGMPSVAAGRYRMDAFGPFQTAELTAGRPAIVADSETDARVSPAERENWRTLEIVASCALPVMKEGRLVAYVVAQDNRPHEWSDHEITLLEEISERIWSTVERARAEARLREKERELQAATARASTE